jgi:hypothetical protein
MLAKAFGFILLLILLFSGCLQETQEPVPCTLDAKICPDGTVVGRVAPDCEFALCPRDAGLATDTPPPKHFPDSPSPAFQGDCTNGETVMYIRNPCEPLPSSEPNDPDNGGKICPSVCVPMWELKDGGCIFTDCGSGCGPDGKTTYGSGAECEDAAAGKTSGEVCDALNPCVIGDCYKFQDEDRAICWDDDPCKKCESGECNIAESYPMQVFCK